MVEVFSNIPFLLYLSIFVLSAYKLTILLTSVLLWNRRLWLGYFCIYIHNILEKLLNCSENTQIKLFNIFFFRIEVDLGTNG